MVNLVHLVYSTAKQRLNQKTMATPLISNPSMLKNNGQSRELEYMITMTDGHLEYLHCHHCFRTLSILIRSDFLFPEPYNKPNTKHGCLSITWTESLKPKTNRVSDFHLLKAVAKYCSGTLLLECLCLFDHSDESQEVDWDTLYCQ